MPTSWYTNLSRKEQASAPSQKGKLLKSRRKSTSVRGKSSIFGHLRRSFSKIFRNVALTGQLCLFMSGQHKDAYFLFCTKLYHAKYRIPTFEYKRDNKRPLLLRSGLLQHCYLSISTITWILLYQIISTYNIIVYRETIIIFVISSLVIPPVFRYVSIPTNQIGTATTFA